MYFGTPLKVIPPIRCVIGVVLDNIYPQVIRNIDYSCSNCRLGNVYLAISSKTLISLVLDIRVTVCFSHLQMIIKFKKNKLFVIRYQIRRECLADLIAAWFNLTNHFWRYLNDTFVCDCICKNDLLIGYYFLKWIRNEFFDARAWKTVSCNCRSVRENTTWKCSR